MPDNEPIIRLSDARIFQRENLVLNHVDLTVSAGEFVYLIGRTGSGKSSLMRTSTAICHCWRAKGAWRASTCGN
jgi:ABC-type multidrug transport system fused ATPase/permease subunit